IPPDLNVVNEQLKQISTNESSSKTVPVEISLLNADQSEHTFNDFKQLHSDYHTFAKRFKDVSKYKNKIIEAQSYIESKPDFVSTPKQFPKSEERTNAFREALESFQQEESLDKVKRLHALYYKIAKEVAQSQGDEDQVAKFTLAADGEQ